MAATDYNGSYNYPKQKLPRSKKDEKWGRQCIDWVINSASINSYKNFHELKANYDLYNGIISKEDFRYVTEPYGIDQEFPAKLHNYNIITPKLNLLAGEEIKRPFNFRVAAVNADSVSQLQERRKELLLQYCESELINEMINAGVNVQNPDNGDVMTPPQIEKYMNYTESDIRESTANKIANYLIKKENLEYKFNKGFKDVLIADEEFYYIGIDGDEPTCTLVNPIDFEYDMDPDLDFVQDGQWAKHTLYCTVNSILDTYYDDLTEAEINLLDGYDYSGVTNNGTSGNIANSSINAPTGVSNLHDEYNRGYIAVSKVEWKSMRKIGFLKYYDEDLVEQEIIVDETYEPNKELGETIDWVWISEVWEGTKIGDSIYTRIRPKRVQYRSIDNPSIAKLGFVGAVFNRRNTKSRSLLSLVKHHQYLYNIIMYRMELEIAKASGKKMVMDIAQIPRSMGIDMDKWMYYFDSMGIAFINSFEEGKGHLGQGQTSSFNQFTQIDMTLSQSIGQYIGILNKIEEQTETLMGVSRQRQGSISSNETVGGVERAVVQSSHITEPLFYMHNEIKKHVISHLIETAKVVYPASKKINYILDDMSRVMLEINEEFIDADYGVFVTNSAKEVKTLEDLRSVAQQAAASGLMTLTDLITIVDSNSIADIKATVRESEMKAEQAKQAEFEQAQALQEAEADALKELENEKADRLDDRVLIKGEIDKQIAMIKALGFSPDKDVNNNNIPDVLETDRLIMQSKEHNDKMSIEKSKIDLEKEKIKSNERIAMRKAKADEAKAKARPKTSK